MTKLEEAESRAPADRRPRRHQKKKRKGGHRKHRNVLLLLVEAALSPSPGLCSFFFTCALGILSSRSLSSQLRKKGDECFPVQKEKRQTLIGRRRKKKKPSAEARRSKKKEAARKGDTQLTSFISISLLPLSKQKRRTASPPTSSSPTTPTASTATSPSGGKAKGPTPKRTSTAWTSTSLPRSTSRGPRWRRATAGSCWWWPRRTRTRRSTGRGCSRRRGRLRRTS